MTREKAIKVINTILLCVNHGIAEIGQTKEELNEALDMAIEALKEQDKREKEKAFAEHLRDRGY